MIPHECPKCGGQLTQQDYLTFIFSECRNKACYDFTHVHHYECCKTPAYEKRLFTAVNGSPRVLEQCANCGCTKGNALKVSPEMRALLQPGDTKKKDEYDNSYTVISNLRSAYYERAKSLQSDLWWKRYNEYLQSAEWKEKRKAVLQRDKYLCQCCLVNPATQVHHRSYKNVDFTGWEPCFDLISVCDPCHEKIHAKPDNLKKAS